MIEISSVGAPFASVLLELWGAAVGDRHPLTPAIGPSLWAEDPDQRPGDMLIARDGEQPVGFVSTKRLRDVPTDLAAVAARGWIGLLAVHPAYQRRGIGSQLLARAEAQLRATGVTEIRLGESFHHALPGIPSALTEAKAFFAARGYTLVQDVWDVRGDVRGQEAPALPSDVRLRPLDASEREALIAFLAASFPGRWRRDMAHQLAAGEPAANVVGLFVADRLEGFAQLHPPQSTGALRWAGFDPDVAGLGPIGVSEAVRGRGLGLALLQGGLAELARRGASTTVIDWTTLLAFYGRVGFTPWICYHQARKELA